MTSDTVLLSDQVFQLNTFIWALEDLPNANEIKPVLRDAGYRLWAIGRRVFVPLDEPVAVALRNLTGSPDRSACRPDLWLEHSDHPSQLLVELKARGFSSASSNRKQALKLIASASNLADSLGEPGSRPGHVAYATVSRDAHELASTLRDLADALRAAHAPTAPTGVIGLSVESEGVALSSPAPSELPDPACRALATPAVVLPRNGNNDLRPLYIVPWLPGIKDSQDPQLHAEGLSELTARVLTHAIGEVGRAEIPTNLSLRGGRLLRGATFGVFDRWQDSDRNQFTKTAIDIVERTLGSGKKVQRTAPDRLEVDLADPEIQRRMIKRLLKANPADPAANLEGVFHEQLAFFGDLGSNILPHE